MTPQPHVAHLEKVAAPDPRRLLPQKHRPGIWQLEGSLNSTSFMLPLHDSVFRRRPRG
jgi:hypothetical protein